MQALGFPQTPHHKIIIQAFLAHLVSSVLPGQDKLDLCFLSSFYFPSCSTEYLISMLWASMEKAWWGCSVMPQFTNAFFNIVQKAFGRGGGTSLADIIRQTVSSSFPTEVLQIAISGICKLLRWSYHVASGILDGRGCDSCIILGARFWSKFAKSPLQKHQSDYVRMHSNKLRTDWRLKSSLC